MEVEVSHFFTPFPIQKIPHHFTLKTSPCLLLSGQALYERNVNYFSTSPQLPTFGTGSLPRLQTKASREWQLY